MGLKLSLPTGSKIPTQSVTRAGVEIYELWSCQELCQFAVLASDWLLTLNA